MTDALSPQFSRFTPEVEEVYRDEKTIIVSDENVTRAEAAALAAQVEKAYAWDEQQLSRARGSAS